MFHSPVRAALVAYMVTLDALGIASVALSTVLGAFLAGAVGGSPIAGVGVGVLVWSVQARATYNLAAVYLRRVRRHARRSL